MLIFSSACHWWLETAACYAWPGVSDGGDAAQQAANPRAAC